ncbi:MAG: hypothetical protein FE834_00030 [Gammaproteobacteria bacterium]|nr:hypothetical protein [Gammaproteobacteria bacterium]
MNNTYTIYLHIIGVIDDDAKILEINNWDGEEIVEASSRIFVKKQTFNLLTSSNFTGVLGIKNINKIEDSLYLQFQDQKNNPLVELILSQDNTCDFYWHKGSLHASLKAVNFIKNKLFLGSCKIRLSSLPYPDPLKDDCLTIPILNFKN